MTDLSKNNEWVLHNFAKNDGELIKVHELGDYWIAEYHPYKEIDGRFTQSINYEKTEYIPYVFGQCTGHIYNDLDSAILHAIGHKYDGINSQFVYFASRMLNMPE